MNEENKVFEYDVEKAKELIMKESNGTIGRHIGGAMAKQISTLQPELWPLVEGWLEGKKLEYEFQGITLQMIKEKERGTYIENVFRMSLLMEDPSRIEFWKKRTYRIM